MEIIWQPCIMRFASTMLTLSNSWLKREQVSSLHINFSSLSYINIALSYINIALSYINIALSYIRYTCIYIYTVWMENDWYGVAIFQNISPKNTFCSHFPAYLYLICNVTSSVHSWSYIVDPNIAGEDGATPIHYAARYRPLNVLKQSKSQEDGM